MSSPTLQPSLSSNPSSPSSLPPMLTQPPSSDSLMTLRPTSASLAPSSGAVLSSSRMPIEIIVLIAVAAFVVLACVIFLCYRKFFRRKDAVATANAGSVVEKVSERESRFRILSRIRTTSSPRVGSLSHEYEEYHVTTPPTRKLRSLSISNRPRLSERKSGDASVPPPAATLPLPVPPRDRGSFIVPPPTLMENPDSPSPANRPIVAGIVAALRPRGATDPTRGLRGLNLLSAASSNPPGSPTLRSRSKTGIHRTARDKPPPLPDPEPEPPPPAPSRKPTSAPVPLPVDFGDSDVSSASRIQVVVDDHSTSSLASSSSPPPASSGIQFQLTEVIIELNNSQTASSSGISESKDTSSSRVTNVTSNLSTPDSALDEATSSINNKLEPTFLVDNSSVVLIPGLSVQVPTLKHLDSSPVSPFVDMSLSQITSHTSFDPPSPHSLSFSTLAESSLRDSPPLRDPPPPPIPVPRPPSSREPPSPSSQNDGVKSRVRAFEARSLSEQRLRAVAPPIAPSPRISPPSRTRSSTAQIAQPASPRVRTLSSNATSSENPWIQRANKQGKIYYLNINTGESVWDNPDSTPS